MSDIDSKAIAAGAVIGDCYEVIEALHVGKSSAVYADHRSDIYSLGCSMFEALTALLLFQANRRLKQ